MKVLIPDSWNLVECNVENGWNFHYNRYLSIFLMFSYNANHMTCSPSKQE